MHAHTDFTLTITKYPSNAKRNDVVDYMLTFMDENELDPGLVEAKEGTVFHIEETYELVWIDDITHFAAMIAKHYPDIKFSISGIIDTSESAGEYMNFVIEYNGKRTLTVRSSKWYQVIDNEDDDVENYPFEKEYRSMEAAFKDLGWPLYLIENGFSEETPDELSNSVPLSDVREIKV